MDLENKDPKEILMAILLSKGYSISEKQSPLFASCGSEELLNQFIGKVIYPDKPQPLNYKSLSRNQRMAVMAIVRSISNELLL